MKKKDKLAQTVIILAISVILIILVTGGIGGISDIIKDIVKEKYQIRCNVVIKDPIFGGPSIDSYTCSMTGTCVGLKSSYSSLLNNEGNVIILGNDGATATKAFSVFKLGGTKTITLDLCTTSTAGLIKITDKHMNIISSEEVRFVE